MDKSQSDILQAGDIQRIETFIPLSVPSIRGNEWLYVKECLNTGWVSSAGSFVERFEKDICSKTGAKYAVACVNGTAALQISLILAGVDAGDEVIVPALTFIAPINAVRYIGAEPIFMDSDDYYNIDIEKTIEFLETETHMKNGNTYNKRTSKRISAMIPVHVFGNAVRIDELVEICEVKNIKIVEDSTEALGTVYSNGKHAGTTGMTGCFSFNGNKIITTGGGGMIVTNNKEIADKARYLTTQAKDDEVRYIHEEVGYNFRLTNILAAIGTAQLEMLDEYVNIKRRNYKIYKEEITGIEGLYVNEMPDYADNNCWMYALRIDKDIYGKDREQLMGYLGSKKIQSRPVWYLNHLQKPYEHCQNYKIENAIRLHENTLNIPCSVDITETEIERVIDALKD